MSEVLYPKPKRAKDKSHRPWRVEYNLTYDGGGSRWTGFYRTRTASRVAAWWNVHLSSWGGDATLVKNTSTN